MSTNLLKTDLTTQTCSAFIQNPQRETLAGLQKIYSKKSLGCGGGEWGWPRLESTEEEYVR